VGALARDLPGGRVVFGSHFPLFYFESAELKVREAGFGDAEEKAILEDNALMLIGAG
jgi:predicted TIM-barrel fold metal-dependent hydrolase